MKEIKLQREVKHSLDLNSNQQLTDQQFMLRFYETNRAFLFHAARKFVNTQSDCEDIIQDAMVRLMRNIPTLRRLSSNQVATYLYLTVRSVYADRMKSPQNRIILISDDKQEFQDDSVQFAYDAKWDAEILKNTLASKDWNLLESKYILGYSDDEIAQELGCAADSVRTLLRRARNRAKAILESGREGND